MLNISDFIVAGMIVLGLVYVLAAEFDRAYGDHDRDSMKPKRKR